MAAPILLMQRGLYTDASNWILQTGDNVNKPASVFFMASKSPDDGAMVIVNGLDKPFGGALVTYKLPLPVVGVAATPLPYIAWESKVMLPYYTRRNCVRLENDLKVCIKNRPSSTTSIKNVANFSTQWNGDTGNWQIDQDPPAWVNVPGAITPELTPDVWHRLGFRFWFDPVALVFSVLSIRWDDQVFQIPASMQKVPMLSTNWETVAALQLQNEGAQPGSVVVLYDRGGLAWSDQPIGELPQLFEDLE